jgi:hypothetical protein
MMIKTDLAATLVAVITAFTASATMAATGQPKPPANVCINDASHCATEPPGEPSGKGVKWHPGNYMLTYKGAPQSQLDSIRNEPYVIGAVRRYYWAQLEPSAGVYDFSAIESDLKYLKSMPTPKRLVIQLYDREYRANTPVGFIPNYILEDARYGGKEGWYLNNGSRWYGVAPAKSGYIARNWDPAVMDRWIALFRAVAARFDNEPYLEAVSGQETTPGLKGNLPPDYSREKLANEVKRWVSEVVPAFPRTNVLIYTNDLGGQVAGLIDHCFKNRCAVGGLDTMPTHDYSLTSSGPTEGQLVIMGANGGPGYARKMPVMFIVSNPSLIGKEGPNTPDAIYRYSTERLGVTHLFWIRLGTEGDTASQKYSWEDGILPVIRAYQGRTNMACPPNLRTGCDTN